LLRAEHVNKIRKEGNTYVGIISLDYKKQHEEERKKE
jgi:hypothetical protein